jgi:putative ABC transport system ATP-binding protein
MNASPPVLQMDGAAKSFPSPAGAVEVLRRIDVRVCPGDFLMITGPSGSGKSTLLNLAALLDPPTSGRILFRDRDVTDAPEAERCAIRRQEIGMVFQKFCLLPHRSALDNVAFRFRYTSVDPREGRAQARKALAEMGLEGIEDRPARLLSAGEMQRVAVARAVASPPTLLVADEPTGNLDRASADAVMDCFQRLHARGLTIVMVTHNEGLLKFCTRHMACRDGILAP